MEHNILDEERPHNVATQFELSVGRIMTAWINEGQVTVSSGDLRLAAEFLRQAGFTVEETEGVMVKLRGRDGRWTEMTREDAVMVAVRCLAERTHP